MSYPERTTSSSWATAIVQALELEGLRGTELFADLGLDYSLLSDPDARFPQDQMTRLWQRAVSLSGDPAIGLGMGKVIRPANFNVVGFSLLSSKTLKDSLARLVRYQRIIGEASDMALVQAPDSYVLELQIHGDSLPAPTQSHDAALAYLLAFFRWMTGERINPQCVEFAYPQPADVARYEALFECPLLFSRPHYSIAFSRQVMEAPLATGNESLAQLHDQFAGEYLARFEQTRVTHQARQVLCRLLPQGEPKRQAVASALRMSTRTLQRRLQEENTSFQQLLDETRRELAMQFLRQKRMTLLEIAYLLGFADPSNFFRAFKRWFGIPPGQYREQLLAAQSVTEES
ncbi:AraC family transcriptional regulator [Halopseudomonas pelagia]|uniref:AraC family transcriptional regulator n=1 Tax=Halopseudomonas pelagia TaxID=553151 RepID=UPI0003A768D5|nr:AraC family transcriptional regulator [Halopseudomonas pelagia]|tara:strand:- start:45585 stop:46622 length:1038 start_codon:yes stop_codon:yes gene_type:complete